MAQRARERDAETLAAVETCGDPGEPLTASEVAEALDVTRRAAYDRLEAVAERGDLRTKKVGAKGRVWWRPPDATNGDAAFAQSLVEAQPDLVYAFDAEGRLQRWNDRVPSVTGYDSAELRGMGPTELIADDHAERVMELFAELADGGDRLTVEVPVATTDGETIPYEFTGAPVVDDDGTVTGVTGVGRDVSDRVAREQQLRRERDVSDQLIEATPATIVVFADDGTVERVNERAAERLGIEPSADSGTRVGPAELDVYDAEGDRIPPEDRAAIRAFETGEPVEDFHCQIDLPVGGMQWLSLDAIPLGDGETPERVLVVAHDITALKHRAQRLERERADLETELEEVFARVDDGFLALDDSLRFTLINERAEAILEADADALLGRALPEALPDTDENPLHAAATRAMESGAAETVEARYPPVDGWLEVTAYPSASGCSLYVRDVSERKRREAAIDEQRERLAALHNLNAVVRDSIDAVLQQSSRADVEKLVCERLAETDSYEFAWIGEGDAADARVEPRAHAGASDYVEDVVVSTSAAEPTGRGPGGRALRTGELQTCSNVAEEAEFEPWREFADEFGFSAVAAIPLEHAGTTYGVLCLYADREGAFAAEERAVVAHLGEVVGHAIAAIDRKQALLGDQVIELELAVPDPFPDVGDVDIAGRVDIEQTVPVGDGTHLVYGTADDAGFDSLRTLVEAVDAALNLTSLFETDDGVRYAVRIAEPPLMRAVADHGGSIEGGHFAEGTYTMVVHLPTDADVRSFIDGVSGVTADVSVVARRQVARNRSAAAVAGDLAEALTDRQRAALEAGYHAGYFDWPRESDGAEVAESLSIASPTFHQHLRSAQKKLLDALLE